MPEPETGTNAGWGEFGLDRRERDRTEACGWRDEIWRVRKSEE